MNTINLLAEKMKHAMSIDHRNFYARLTKLLEEQGELAESILALDSLSSVEEAVDNVLIVASIGFMVEKDSLTLFEETLNTKYFSNHINDVNIDFMEYSRLIGLLSESIQKNQKTKTSHYKGYSTDEEVIKIVNLCCEKLAHILHFFSVDCAQINDLIAMKYNKWIEKSS